MPFNIIKGRYKFRPTHGPPPSLSANLPAPLSLSPSEPPSRSFDIKISASFFKRPLVTLIYFFPGVKAAEDPGAHFNTREFSVSLLTGGRRWRWRRRRRGRQRGRHSVSLARSLCISLSPSFPPPPPALSGSHGHVGYKCERASRVQARTQLRWPVRAS